MLIPVTAGKETEYPPYKNSTHTLHLLGERCTKYRWTLLREGFSESHNGIEKRSYAKILNVGKRWVIGTASYSVGLRRSKKVRNEPPQFQGPALWCFLYVACKYRELPRAQLLLAFYPLQLMCSYSHFWLLKHRLGRTKNRGSRFYALQICWCGVLYCFEEQLFRFSEGNLLTPPPLT